MDSKKSSRITVIVKYINKIHVRYNATKNLETQNIIYPVLLFTVQTAKFLPQKVFIDKQLKNDTCIALRYIHIEQ
jgi:hypothetical protein